uniref:Uncharacterized protein n=1 Tax=Oryza sativa subsp. japonica TaxID=39947 RepID=Q69SA5_ORYSJ|nr:hypothetical protein [Oryza sativa Japonica Group]BAD30862.1 hypothetical protein [Oryza sativa Japonica Group]
MVLFRAPVDDGASLSGAVPLPTWRGDAERNRNRGGGASMAGGLLLPRRFACTTVAGGRRQPLWRRPVG